MNIFSYFNLLNVIEFLCYQERGSKHYLINGRQTLEMYHFKDIDAKYAERGNLSHVYYQLETRQVQNRKNIYDYYYGLTHTS